MIMQFSKEQRDLFLQWLATVDNRLTGCPVCRSNKEFSRDMADRAAIFRLDDQSHPDPDGQFVTVRCGCCGATQFFSARIIGIQL
jgi:predicted nucleic-acid-binding Zn-ribbon protein